MPRADASRPVPRQVVLFATADWDNPMWTNKQHMAVHLARAGFRVLYVESLGLRRPTLHGRDLSRIVRRLARGLQPLRKVRENIWVYSPLVLPFHGSAVSRWLNHRSLLAHLRFFRRRLRMHNPLMLTYNPMVTDLADALPWAGVVYHCVDDLSAAPGMPADALAAADRAMCERADLVFATSRSLQQRCEQWAAGRAHYFPNVADFEHFSCARNGGLLPADLAVIPSPRIGFVGAISDYKVDFDLIAHVARARPDWHWVMIGRVGEGQPGTSVEKLQQPNIHLLGPRPYSQLPDYLRGFDVAALPCPLNDYTRSMFPMKFFEYLAAGRSVVATPLDALQEFSDACRVADSPDSFAAAIDDILAGRRPDPDLCLKLAQRHTWQARLDEILATIDQTL